MGIKSRCALLALTLVLMNVLGADAQLRPDVTPPQPAAPAAPKLAQIVIQTSPNAQIYLDEVLKGKASAAGRFVIENPRPGECELRISLPGKKDFRQSVTVVAGKEVKVAAALVDLPANLSPKPTRPPAPTPGEVRVNTKDGLKYVWIPAGSFAMGCSPGDDKCVKDEKPAHQVTITKGFWMGQTEVTVGAYKRYAGSAAAQMPAAPDFNADWSSRDMPMVNVSWDNATAFCGWAGGRLPTEAEWEYAARGGSTERQYGSLDDVAWYHNNSGEKTHEVGRKLVNAFGLYDILGNAWEWVSDWFDPNYYQNSPSQDPPGPANGDGRVLRGGSWSALSRGVRVSVRRQSLPALVHPGLGFRCGGQVFAP